MKMPPRWILILVIGLIAEWATPTEPVASELARLRSRLEQMAGSFVSEAEWNAWVIELQALEWVARDGGDEQMKMEAALLLARGWGDVRRQGREAVLLLRKTRGESRGRNVTGRQRIYLAEAALLARLGDVDAISALIEEFRSGPDFDETSYAWSGGAGPDSPLAVVRPRAQGSGSVTVMAMERFRREARFAVGAKPPRFDLAAVDGRRWNSDALLGRVVLLDFWLAGSPASSRLRRHLDRLSARYGTDIVRVGICLNLDWEGLVRNRSGERAEMGAEVGRDSAGDFLRALGIFGDVQVIVVDRDGRIAARVRDGVSLEQEVGRLFPSN